MRFDVFAHQFLSPWDIAVPGLIAREAGAKVLSLKTGGDAMWDEARGAGDHREPDARARRDCIAFATVES
jgi:fructose-1,6-bisphosphatase/inositol monophosphatase family enzyme